MDSATVSLAQVNHFLWKRQGFDLNRHWTEESARTAPIGLYGFGPSLYPSLLARFAGFRFEDLNEALYERRSLIRMQAMRRSLFAVPRPILPVVFQALQQRHLEAFDKLLIQLGVSREDYTRTSGLIARQLQGRNMTTAEIKKSLAPLQPQVERAFRWILDRMCAEGRLALGRVRGGWKSALVEYSLFENWLPGIHLGAVEPGEARAALARLYFETYGPASESDFHWWSGFSRIDVDQAFGELKKLLVTLKIRGLPGEYYLLEQNWEPLHALAAGPPTGAALLPVWDAYLMAYRERARYLMQEWYDRVYDASGNSTSIVLLAGRIAGVWDIEENADTFTLKVSLFEPAGAQAWRELRSAAERLAGEVRMKSSAELRLLRCPPPPPLPGASQNQFRSPLCGISGEPV